MAWAFFCTLHFSKRHFCTDISSPEYFGMETFWLHWHSGTWTFWEIFSRRTRTFQHGDTTALGHLGTRIFWQMDVLALGNFATIQSNWTFWHRHFGEMCYCPEMFIFPKYLCAKMSLWRKVPVPKYPDAEISLCRRVHVPNSLLAKTPCRNVPGMKCPSGNVSCRNVRFWYKPKPTELVIQWTICCYIDARMSASKKDLPVTSL